MNIVYLHPDQLAMIADAVVSALREQGMIPPAETKPNLPTRKKIQRSPCDSKDAERMCERCDCWKMTRSICS